MNASLIEEFHLQFQRLVEELKQSLAKELENKAAELYTLFLYHLSAAYSPVGHLPTGSNGLLRHHPLPSSLVSPLASPLAPGPRGPGSSQLPSSLGHHGQPHPQHTFINTHSPIRGNNHQNHPAQQSTFFFRAPPHSLHSNGANSNVIFSSTGNASNNNGPAFFPVPGPPVMMEFAEAQSRGRNEILNFQQHQQQLQQLQHQHQSLGAITKVTSALNGLPHQSNSHQQTSVRAPPPPSLPPIPQQVQIINRPPIRPGQPGQQPLPLRPQAQKAPTAIPFVRSANPSNGNLISPSTTSTTIMTPQVVMPIVQNPPPLQSSNLATQTSSAAKTSTAESLPQTVVVAPPSLSSVQAEKSAERPKSPESLASQPASPATPSSSTLPLSPSNTSETEKEETTSILLATQAQASSPLASSSSATEKESSFPAKNTTKSVEPMDLSRTSPTTAKLPDEKTEQTNKKDSNNSEEIKNDNKKCSCTKCKHKEARRKEKNANENNDNENDNDDDDEDDEDDEDEAENDDDEDEEEEMEDEDVQVVSEDDEELYLEEVEETKEILEKHLGSKKDENGGDLAFNLSKSSIPAKRIKISSSDSSNNQKEQTNSKSSEETSSKGKTSNPKFPTLKRSLSLDLSNASATTSETSFLVQKPITSASSSSEITQPQATTSLDDSKNVDSNDNNKNQTTLVNGSRKRKLESLSPPAPEIGPEQAHQPELPVPLPLPHPFPSFPESPVDLAEAYLNSENSKVRHFKTLSVKCLLDDCPATFEKLEELDEHLIEGHCILPHRCVMQGCTLSFSSTYELGRHYRIDHQGDGVKVWQCSKCGMKSKGNHYLLKHMYNYHYEGVFRCAKGDCPYQAKYRQQVVNHYRRHHLPVPERFDLVPVPRVPSQAMVTQQCPLEGCRVTIRNGELPLRRHLDQVHNGFAVGGHLHSSASLKHAKDQQLRQQQQQQQQQLFFRSLTDSSIPSTSTSLLNFERGQLFPQANQREFAIASAAAAAAAAEVAAASAAASTSANTLDKYANERNATTYNIISVNCTVEGCPVAAASAPMRSVEELERHLEAVHGILPFRCYLCPLSFGIVRDLDVHLLESHLGQIEWPCPRCDHKRKSHHALANHVLKFHHSGAFACPSPGCGHISGLRIEAIRHYNRLHCEYACKVDGCGRIFKAKDCLRAHEAADHVTRGGDVGDEADNQHFSGAFTCNTCGKPFSTKGNLKTHQRIHLGVKPFRCRFNGCGKSFRAKEHLTIHERTHSGIKPYRCTWPECGHQTTDRSSMIAHVRGFHFRLPYKLKEQKERNIVDDRDPRQFVEVLPELLKYESFIHVFTG